MKRCAIPRELTRPLEGRETFHLFPVFLRFLIIQASIICRFARAMLKMENFHEVWGFAHPVINQNRSMRQLAHSWPPFNQAADVREAFEKLDMIK